jgi:hypothetical protein
MDMPRKQTLFRQTNYSIFTGMCSVFVQDLCVTCRCEVCNIPDVQPNVLLLEAETSSDIRYDDCRLSIRKSQHENLHKLPHTQIVHALRTYVQSYRLEAQIRV